MFEKIKKLFGDVKKRDTVDADKDTLDAEDNLDDLMGGLEKENARETTKLTEQSARNAMAVPYPNIGVNLDELIKKSIPNENWEKRSCVQWSTVLELVLNDTMSTTAPHRLTWIDCKSCGARFTYYPAAQYTEYIGQYSPQNYGEFMSPNNVSEENLLCPDCFFGKMKQGNGEEINDLRREINEQIVELKKRGLDK